MLQWTHWAFSPCIGVYARVGMAWKERFQHLEAADGARRETRLGLQSTVCMSDTSRIHTQTGYRQKLSLRQRCHITTDPYIGHFVFLWFAPFPSRLKEGSESISFPFRVGHHVKEGVVHCFKVDNRQTNLQQRSFNTDILRIPCKSLVTNTCY